MIICSPEGRPNAEKVAMRPRPATLEGLRIGLFDNTKAPVDRMMAHLAVRLRERHPDAETFYVSKKHPSLPAEPEVLEALKRNADVVITALGD